MIRRTSAAREGLPRFAHWWRPRSGPGRGPRRPTRSTRPTSLLTSAIFVFVIFSAAIFSTPVTYAAPTAASAAVAADAPLDELEGLVDNGTAPAHDSSSSAAPPDSSSGRGGELITELAFQLPKRNSKMQAVITEESWEDYLDFKKSTCRKEKEDAPPGLVFSSPESGFFSWEESVFHQELRKILLPETNSENFTSLLHNATLVEQLDSRLLASELESLCTEKDRMEEKAVHDQAAFVATEKALFEDYLINKVMPWIIGEASGYNATQTRPRSGREPSNVEMEALE